MKALLSILFFISSVAVAMAGPPPVGHVGPISEQQRITCLAPEPVQAIFDAAAENVFTANETFKRFKQVATPIGPLCDTVEASATTLEVIAVKPLGEFASPFDADVILAGYAVQVRVGSDFTAYILWLDQPGNTDFEAPSGAANIHWKPGSEGERWI